MSEDNGMAIVVSSSHMDDDDRPLSTWFGGMLHCPTSVKESRLSPGSTVVECNEASEGQVDIMQQVPAADDTGGCVLNENRSLPFVKSSLLWKTLESMEIFRMMPQDPHFHPLGICKEEYREGLAIGNMVTFASLTEKISKLHLDQSRSILCGYLESLVDLEKHGFDVTFLRGRMNKLLSIKDRQEQILNESKDAECKIFKYHREKTEMADKMVNITKQIAELEGKRALINSEMERKKVESSRLQMRVDAIKEDIQSAQLDFEKVAAAPWKLG
ncbi:hypothetical protein CJ030_MR0G010416 [Morella rubra]|nr:hypothetical protein CJ030_MR0G010416 [Morella rubra]